jgi:hypothetical protein
VVEAIVDPVDDGAVGVERSETAPAGLHHTGLVAQVEEAVVLACETGRGQVFGGGRASDGHADGARVSRRQGAEGRGDLLSQRRAARRCINDGARARASPGELGDVGGIEVVKQRLEFSLGARFAQGVPVGRRGDGESVGHADGLGSEQPPQLAQRRRLAADKRHIVHSQRVERPNVDSPVG